MQSEGSDKVPRLLVLSVSKLFLEVEDSIRLFLCWGSCSCYNA